MRTKLKHIFVKNRRWVIAGVCLSFFGVWFYCSLPDPLFNDPYSTVLVARNHDLLSASIARDGQWRFPPANEVPEKFQQAIITFEDKRFYSHPGVDVLSLGKALQQNLRSGKVVRGGSTITMQVIRLFRKGKPRTVTEKIYEMILATRLEFRYSKKEILRLYANHAPFGGNVVGFDAACWRYFGRNQKDLSWGEAALIAVLPNAPALIHPGKNRDDLLLKRNALLDRMKDAGIIDAFTCSLAKEELIPPRPHPLPRFASHLLGRGMKEGLAQRKIVSTIDFQLQQRAEEILARHRRRLNGNQIHNGCAIVANVRTGEVLAYVGNVSTSLNEGRDIDLVMAERSTGSILKPILFAATLDEGKILPRSLVPDIPAFLNGFTPKNFTHEYDGAVPADKALIRSLNIPAVLMLKDYRYEKFHSLLQKTGISTLKYPPDHYGLSLILGGAEATLWDVTGVYASMARTLNNYFTHPGKNRYSHSDFHSLNYRHEENEAAIPDLRESSYLSASSIYQTFTALKELYRPGEETGWRHFESSKPIAWKTGTSFGFRDGWAVGVTPDYVVGVWIGNADGEGRPGLTGVETAAPVMFDLFSQLKAYTWFQQPFQEMKKITVCSRSGFRNSELCGEVDTVWVSLRGLTSEVCPYHKKVHLTMDGRHQLNSGCSDINSLNSLSWFVLPPVQEYYYKTKNVGYKPLPPFREDCPAPGMVKNMDLVYPKPGAKLFIPRDLMGNPGSAVFHLAHRHTQSTVYWYLDGNYQGSTQKNHFLAINPPSGRHHLLVIDDHGDSLEESFEVLSTM